MRKKLVQEIEIPQGISCTLDNRELVAKKGSDSLKKKFDLPSIKLEIKNNKVTISSEKGNKIDFKRIMSSIAHVKNMFLGLDNKFVFKLEACNVHFPMTLKLDNGFLVVSNFLGEKIPRRAKILPNVEVDLKGQKITVSSRDIESAGATATNMEKATIVKNRDRRVFQDGIFITEKPGAAQ
jgi:large subunit ribosomal protein L6